MDGINGIIGVYSLVISHNFILYYRGCKNDLVDMRVTSIRPF